MASAGQKDAVVGPRARQAPFFLHFGAVPGQNRGVDPMDPPVMAVDEYYWLRDDARKDPEILAHIAAENEHTEAVFGSPFKAFTEELYQETKAHLKETDAKVPYQLGRHFYYTRTEAGKSYKIHARRPGPTESSGPETIVLDENAVASGHNYSEVGAVEVSPSGNLLAYSVDYEGGETYEHRFVDLATGLPAGTSVPAADGAIAWATGDEAVFYCTLDAAHRPYRLYRHALVGELPDELLFEEPDEKFWLGFSRSRSGRFLFLECGSKETSETHAIDLAAPWGSPASKLRCLAPREQGVLYDVSHRGESFFVVTNANGAKNFTLMVAPLTCSSRVDWAQLPYFPYDPSIKVDFMSCFASHAAVFGREGGMTQLWVMDFTAPGAPAVHRLALPEAACRIGPGENREYDLPGGKLRLSYSSLVTPESTMDYDVAARTLETLKETEVGGYDRTKYATERLMLPARDGTRVPVSLVFRKDSSFAASGRAGPLLLYGYGSYGSCIEPSFDFTRLPLLDRGVVYAIAHVRGGGEMGRSWYEDEGKYLTKKNTFFDFVDVARALVAAGRTTPDRLAINGRSAGGLLVGAALNLAPDLFRVAVAGVPFVDVMGSMCDSTIPLTVIEWEEWGCPNAAKFYQYMRSYSPYENIVPGAQYPALLITAGLHDPRVAYWEPLKYAARLRERAAPATAERPILVKLDTGAGHFSASDRYKYIRERSYDYAFILVYLGLGP